MRHSRRSFLGRLAGAASAPLAALAQRAGSLSADIQFYAYRSTATGWLGWLERAGQCVGFVRPDGTIRPWP